MHKKTIGDWSLDISVYLVLLLSGLATLLPLANVLSKAISDESAVVSGRVGIFPVGFQLDTMKHVVSSAQFLHSIGVSLLITVVGTVLSILLTAITAYPLSKRHLPGISFIMLLFIFTMLFNGGIIPNYLLMKQLHLINSLWSLMLPALISVFNMLVIKSYYESLPEALEESARMDGARNFTILFRIIIPLSVPVIATIALFYAVYFWNDYFHPMLYINDASLKPLQLYLRDIVMDADSSSAINKSVDDMMNVSPEGVRAATVIASIIPMLLVYPYLQKHFVKGVLIGSVKG
ncbi:MULTISPECIES: carbohydrate ABC transporter permease [Paenibacillus]|jgi:putative aldouronate transport system permease protein|uniref:Carbohydrate ABC transporter permease n=1 Tax=Paenibacillus baimaensis TaxID=2982185 RepID=A0ABT2U8T3_9BACL|nr:MULTISPECIES: carbohydrate ABC transporter permease [unclassified Paenibacillus]MCU6791039.1 carbohydrate ABC transporter permease [Paenibacillus sp. WQ 127069]OMF19193.1 sugar ABC transporter permease [Paenibacillus sp. FSL H7-0331]